MKSLRIGLRKAQGAVIKCLKSLAADASQNYVKDVLRKQFSLLPMRTHVAMRLMHTYQQKGENLQEFNFEFSEIIQAVTNNEPEDITDPLKIYMYAQNKFNPAISSKTISHAHPTIQKPYIVHKRLKENPCLWKESNWQNLTL